MQVYKVREPIFQLNRQIQGQINLQITRSSQIFHNSFSKTCIILAHVGISANDVEPFNFNHVVNVLDHHLKVRLR